MQLNDAVNGLESNRDFLKTGSAFKTAWLYGLALKPRATLAAILEKDRPAWLIPLVLLTLLAVLEALVFSHLRMTEMSNRIRDLDFIQTMSPEEQAFQFRLIGPPVRPLYVYVTPLLYTAGRLWIAWFLLSMVMNLILTSTGAKSSLAKTQNLIAWAFLPLGLRYLVQTASMLLSQTVIANRGLSSLLVSDPAVQQTQQSYYVTSLFQSLLGSVDIFFLWAAALLVLGVAVGFGFTTRGKAIATGLSAAMVALLMMALSGFLVVLLRSNVGSVLFRATWYFQFAW